MDRNQAVVFTKPVHHASSGFSADSLCDWVASFLMQAGFQTVERRRFSGASLAARDVIKAHYRMYSRAACSETVVADDALKAAFNASFGRSWDSELAAGRICSTEALLTRTGMNAEALFLLWERAFSTKETHKLQPGFIMAWLPEVDAYCVNGFYPSLEENFYHPDTVMDYFVVTFDPQRTSWLQFRQEVLGSTNAQTAHPTSLRGQLYADYPGSYPGRDNFVHGSAGPLEGLLERSIHEEDFQLEMNPVGEWMATYGVTLKQFSQWISGQSALELSGWFDATEELDTTNAINVLESMDCVQKILHDGGCNSAER